MANMRPTPAGTLDLATLRASLEGHRLELEKLELLVLDDAAVLEEPEGDSVRPIRLEGSRLELHDFSNLRILTAPWVLIAGPSKGEHPSPLRYLIPKSVVQLTLTDDLFQQPYWDWNNEEIWETLSNYLHDVKETNAALDAMFLVGPRLSNMFDDQVLQIVRGFARFSGVSLWTVELTVDDRDALRDAEERARRYG